MLASLDNKKPVTFPPGRAKLSTSPSAIGSSTLPNQIKGIVRVTLRAAKIADVDPTKIAAGLRATRSETRAGKRSAIPSANRDSILMLRPSMYPKSRNPFRSAARLRAAVASERGDMTPTSGVAGCCDCEASGHAAAAPPINVMNSRRLVPDIGLPLTVAPPVGLPHVQTAAEGGGKSLGQT